MRRHARLHFIEGETELFGFDHEPLEFRTQQLGAFAASAGFTLATTLPTAGVVTSTPSATSAAITLCAVFGLIRSSWLNTRTDGNFLPGATDLPPPPFDGKQNLLRHRQAGLKLD